MSTSTDEQITKDLIETLEDGHKGFAEAAERLTDSDRADLAPKMATYSTQRLTFANELRAMANAYGDDIKESGSLVGTAHRGWMALADAFTGSGPESVLKTAEQGEDHAVTEYKKALAEDISPNLRTTINRQFGEVKAAHDDIRALKHAFDAK